MTQNAELARTRQSLLAKKNGFSIKLYSKTVTLNKERPKYKSIPLHTCYASQFPQLRSKSHKCRFYSREHSLINPRVTRVARCTSSVPSNCNGYILSTDFKRLFSDATGLGREIPKYLSVRKLKNSGLSFKAKPSTSNMQRCFYYGGKSFACYPLCSPGFAEYSECKAKQIAVLRNHILLQKLKTALVANPRRTLEIVTKVKPVLTLVPKPLLASPKRWQSEQRGEDRSGRVHKVQLHM